MVDWITKTDWLQSEIKKAQDNPFSGVTGSATFAPEEKPDKEYPEWFTPQGTQSNQPLPKPIVTKEMMTPKIKPAPPLPQGGQPPISLDPRIISGALAIPDKGFEFQMRDSRGNQVTALLKSDGTVVRPDLIPQGFTGQVKRDSVMGRFDLKTGRYTDLQFEGISTAQRVHAAGWGDVWGMASGALEYFGMDSIAEQAKLRSGELQAEVPGDLPQATKTGIAQVTEPAFWWGLWRSVPFMEAIMPTAAVGTVAGGALSVSAGLGALGTQVLTAITAGGTSAVAEGMMEAGGGRNEAINRGFTKEMADEAFIKILVNNVFTLSGSNALEFLLAFSPIKGGKFATLLGVGGGALSEGIEEVLQDIYTRQALGDRVEWDDSMTTQFLSGAVMGGLFVGGGQALQSLQNITENSLPKDLKNKLHKDVDRFIAEGKSGEEANALAFNELAKDKRGAAFIRKSAELFNKLYGEEKGGIDIGRDEPVKPSPIQKVRQQYKDKIKTIVEEAKVSAQEEKGYSKDVIKSRDDATKFGIRKIQQEYKDKIKTEAETKSALVDYIKKNLSLESQGKFIKAVEKTKTEAKLNEQMDRVDVEVERVARKDINAKIDKALKTFKTKKERGYLKGKYTADVQNELNELLSVEGRAQMSLADLKSFASEVEGASDAAIIIRADKIAAEQDRINKTIDGVIEVLTGGKGLKDVSKATPSRDLVLQQNRIKEFLTKFVHNQLGFDDLMDELSKFDRTSKPNESRLSEFAAHGIHRARFAEMAGEQNVQTAIVDGAMQAMGIKKPKEFNIRLNRLQTVKELVGVFTDLDGKTAKLEFTADEKMKRYMELKDPTLTDTFTNTMRYTQEMKDAFVESLTKDEKAAADWMMDFYRKYYEGVNKVYRGLFGVDLPLNTFYSPISRDGDLDINEVELLQRDAKEYASTRNGSLMLRTNSVGEIHVTGAFASLARHVKRMEHFKALGQQISDMRKVFGNADVKSAIRQYHGQDAIGVIDDYINKLARGGIAKVQISEALDTLRKHFTYSILGLKPAVAVKQIGSVLAYLSEMPTGDFFEGVADFWKDPVKNYRFMLDNSPYMKDRILHGHERDVFLSMQNKNLTKQMLDSTNFATKLLILIRLGDRFATVQGTWAGYKSVKKENPKLSDEEAFERAAESTERTQPSRTIESLSPFQTAGSWQKLATMFQNQPNKYFRMIANNIRNFKYGRGSRTKAAANVFLAWVILPVLFQLMADAFRWVPEHQLKAVALGPINDLLVIGQLSESIYGWTQGETYGYSPSAAFSSIDDLRWAITKAVKISDPTKEHTVEDVIKMVEYFAKFTGKMTGMPTPYGVQVARGVREKDWRQAIFSKWSMGTSGTTPSEPTNRLDRMREAMGGGTSSSEPIGQSSSGRLDRMREAMKNR